MGISNSSTEDKNVQNTWTLIVLKLEPYPRKIAIFYLNYGTTFNKK